MRELRPLGPCAWGVLASACLLLGGWGLPGVQVGEGARGPGLPGRWWRARGGGGCLGRVGCSFSFWARAGWICTRVSENGGCSQEKEGTLVPRSPPSVLPWPRPLPRVSLPSPHVLPLLQGLLQASQPPEVTSSSGPDAASPGTRPGAALARGAPRCLSIWRGRMLVSHIRGGGAAGVLVSPLSWGLGFWYLC